MAVSSVIPLPKSQPDISKLNTFTGYLVTVTKHLQARGTVGTVVVPTQKMSKDQLLQLQVHLPIQHGSGFYAFTAADEGGTGEDVWLVKLGSDAQEAPMAGPFNGAGGGSMMTPPGAQALGEGVIHLGHNFFYNEAMGTLTTPWRTIVSWKQGDPMPQPPTSIAATPAATPWAQQTPWPNTGWGGYPVNEDSTRVKQLEGQIAEDRRTREMDALRSEMRAQQAEDRRRADERDARMEKLIEKLSAKPQGEDAALAAIRQQNEMLQRKLDDEKRERDAERREAATREEIRRNREDMDRVIRDLQVNKTDPMIPMIMQMMTSQSANAMEAVKAIQAATTTAGSAAERQTNALVEQLRSTVIKPTEIMAMMQGAKGDSAEMARMVLETSKSMMDTQRGVFEQLLDVAGQGNQPPWLQAVQTAMDKIGPIGEAIAARAQQQKVVVQRVAVPVDANGRPTGRPIVTTPPPQSAQIAGAPGQAPPTVAGPTEIRNTTEPAKKARKVKLKSVPGGAPAAPTTAEIADMEADDVAEMIEPFNDVQFFGETLLGLIDNQIRSQVSAGVAANTIADLLLAARPNLATLSPRPAAVELYMAEQIEVLIERVLPDVLFGGDVAKADAYREIVVKKIEETTEKEQEAAEGA